MRRRLTGKRRAKRPRPGALATALAAVLALFFSVEAARAQDARKASSAPTPPDARPLARFVPRDNLSVLIDFDGLDLHADAWKKTAAYKMLNETSLGEMLESMGTQLADKALAFRPGAKVNGADVMAAVKHTFKAGFIFGVNPADAGKDLGTFVVRNGAAKENRAVFSALLGTMMGENKPAVAKKAGRTVVTIPVAGGKDTWSWWTEKNDLVIALGKGTEDAVISTLDGQRPNAVDHPVRAELAKVEGSFTPVGRFIMDYKGIQNPPKGGPFAQQRDQMAAIGLDRIDYRWGFSDNALMSVTRIKAAKPRHGLLAMFDQPTLDKSKLPALPEGQESFTVVSIDPIKSFDAYLAAQPADRKSQINDSLDTLKSKQRVDIRKDVLGRIGPRFAFFSLPSTSSPSRDAEKKEAAPPGDSAPAGAGGLGSMMGMGSMTLPKYTIVTEVDDPVAFGKSLDNLILALNNQLRAAAEHQSAALAPPAAEGDEPATNRRGPRAGGAGRPGGGGSRGGNAAPAPKFTQVGISKETEKTYTLTFPPELARAVQMPATFRPTIRLSGKRLAFSVAADAARAAVEVKAGVWKPSSDLTTAFDELPKNMIALNVSDPRETAPDNLATLPGILQRGVNGVMAAVNAPPVDVAAAGGPGAPAGAPRGPKRTGPFSAPGSGGSGSGGSSDSAAAMPGSSSGYPGSSGSGGSTSMPGMPGMGGGGNAAGGAEAGAMLQFNIDPAKLPKAADLRSKMFPSTYAIDVTDDEIRIVSRQAFPSQIDTLASAAKLLGTPVAQMAIIAARSRAQSMGLPMPGGAMPGAPVAPPAGGAPAPGGSSGPGGQPGSAVPASPPGSPSAPAGRSR